MMLRRIGKVGVMSVRAIRLSRRQAFGPRTIEKGVTEGWLMRCSGEIRIKQFNAGELVYRVNRTPGPYCQCGKRIVDVVRGCCGGRYEYINYFDCERV